MNLALMGENPSVALAKAATEPASLTDEELLVVYSYAWHWFDADARNEILADQGLLVLGVDVDRYYRNRTRWVYGSNSVTAEAWKEMTALGFGYAFESIVGSEMESMKPTGHADILRRLREAAEGS